MQKFNTNIVEVIAIFFERRNELDALIEQEGTCVVQFMLSATHNYQANLNKIIYRDRDTQFNN